MSPARWIAFVALALAPASGVGAQTPFSPIEVQFGAQVGTGSLYKDQSTYVRRRTGGSVGLLLYSHMEPWIGLRIRGDFAIYPVKTSEAGFTDSDHITELALGVDVTPRIIRVSVRDVAARFYAGVALRVMFGHGEDVTVDGHDPRDAPAWRYNGEGVGVVGRAGWFIRRNNKPSHVRPDIGYQIGKVNGVIQHELLIRIGIGN